MADKKSTKQKELDIVYLPRGVANTEDFEELSQNNNVQDADYEKFENSEDELNDYFTLDLNINDDERHERMNGLEKEISRIALEAGSLEEEIRAVEDSEDTKSFEEIAEKYRLQNRYDKESIVADLKDLLAGRVARMNDLSAQKKYFSQDYIEVSQCYSELEQNVRNFSDTFQKNALSGESLDVIKKIDSVYSRRKEGISYRLNCGKKSGFVYDPCRFEISKNPDYNLSFYDFNDKRYTLKLNTQKQGELYKKNKKIGKVSF